MATARLVGAHDELQPWAVRQFERALAQRARNGEPDKHISRADFYAGYRAALIDLKAWSQFRERPTDA